MVKDYRFHGVVHHGMESSKSTKDGFAAVFFNSFFQYLQDCYQTSLRSGT